MSSNETNGHEGSENPRTEALRLHARIGAAVQRERSAVREIAQGLAQMRETRLYRELGYAGLAEYGERAFGFADGKTRQLARLGQRLAKLPALDRTLASGLLGWTKARVVARVATAESEADWIAAALEHSSRALEELAAEARPGAPPADPADEIEGPRYIWARFRLEMHHYELLMRALTRIRHELDDVDLSMSQLLLELAEREVARGEETAGRVSCDTCSADTPTTGQGHGGENAVRSNYRIVVHRCPDCRTEWMDSSRGNVELERTTFELAACDGEVLCADGAAGTPGHIRRAIPPATRRAVIARDDARCRVPGCSNHRYLDLHHVVPRAAGGGNQPDNLVTLCSTHHELVHRGVMRIDRRQDGTLRWRRAGGEPLGLVLSLDRDRAEIDHGYLSEFDGAAGNWCLLEDGTGPAVGPAGESLAESYASESDTREMEHGFHFPRGRTQFLLGDAFQPGWRL